MLARRSVESGTGATHAMYSVLKRIFVGRPRSASGAEATRSRDG